MKQLLLAVVFAASLVTVGSTTAQVYSSRPITIIVPFPAGGSVDAVGRIVAEGMRVSLGQTVVFENVAGAAGSSGSGASPARRRMVTRSAWASGERTWRTAQSTLFPMTC
jgi:tripartite-type tricarboxylate transporter receptor subunit TctC